MQMLVADALEISSLGALSGTAEDFPFSETVEYALDHFKDLTASGTIEITADKDFPFVHANKNRIADVLISMIESWIKLLDHMEKPILHIGHIMRDEESIFYARTKNKTNVKISDDIFSIGSEDAVSRISSLELAMARRIVEAQGGRMWIESGPEIEYNILFTLPEQEKG
jgi:light-regulated signal transduction histidine kinase (bacteriophytochrome)